MLSLVIPTYTVTKELEDIALIAIASYEAHVDEVIVTEDGGWFSPKLMSRADTYIYHNQNIGFVKNVNRAWRLAQYDYVAIANSDTRWHRGNLEDLCIPDRITSPVTKGQDVPLLAGHFFVVPKKFFVHTEFSLLDERLHTFCSDADLERRFGNSIEQVQSVEIYHDLNQTLNAIPGKLQDQLVKDREVYSDICTHT